MILISNLIRAVRTLMNERHRKAVRKWLVSRANERTSLLPSTTKLSTNELSQISEFWGDYPTQAEPFFLFYKTATGKFNIFNIPDDLHIQYIDKKYNNWPLAKAIDNKATYKIWFSKIPQPRMIVYRRNGFWYDDADMLISKENAFQNISNSKNIFIKKATDSYGGKGVFHIVDGKDNLENAIAVIDSISTDIVVQQGIVQSRTLAKINPSSVNTLRIVTWLRNDNSVVNLSNILRMGIGDSKVDNASSGGITVGVNEDGSLKPVAYKNTGARYDEHPTTHIKFNDFRIPSFDKAIEMVMKQAMLMPDFRLISWDVAFDEYDNPVLIEANLCDGELDFHQLNNGPLFGKYTNEMLEEVFGGKND